MTNDHQKIIKIIAKVFLNKLISSLYKKDIANVLIANDIAIIYNEVMKTKISVEELLETAKIMDLSHALGEKVFQISQKGWSWPSRLYSVLKSYMNGYFFQAKDAGIFTDHFRSHPNKVLSSYTIEKLVELISRVKDKDIDIDMRMRAIKALNTYAKRYVPEFKTYNELINKPFYIIAKAVQRVISDEQGKYISLTELSNDIFGYAGVFGFAKVGETITSRKRGSIDKTFITYQKIIDYCKTHVTDYNRRQYIYSMIEAVAYANDTIIITSDNPKNTELKLLTKLRDILIECGIHDDFITLTDINNYFGVKLTAIYSGNYHLFLSTYTDKELLRLAEKTKKTLAKINPASAKKLLLELGNYFPSKRATELISMCPDEASYNKFLYKVYYGDKNTVHDTKWVSIREGLLGKQVAYLQILSHVETDANGRKVRVEYMFDGLTGKIYRADATYPSGRTIWDLHHIDHDKTNNNPDNLIWVVKQRDPVTGETSHKTNLPDNELKKYIAELRLIKIALKYGYPPRLWGQQDQLKYIEEQYKQERKYINP